MSYLSRLIQRNLSGSFDAISNDPFSGPTNLPANGLEAGAIGKASGTGQTGTKPLAKTNAPPAIQRQESLEIEDQAEEQVARSPAADKPMVDTKPRTPAEGLEKESSDIGKSQASPLEAKNSTDNLPTAELSGAPLGVQRMKKVVTKERGSPRPVRRTTGDSPGEEEKEEIVQRASDEVGAAQEAEGPFEDNVISRKADANIQRKAVPQKTVALGSPQAPSKSPGLGEGATPSNPKPAFLGKSQNAPDTIAPDNAPISVKEPVLADKENVVPEALKGIATPVPDARELIPNTYKRPEGSGGLVANTPPPKAKPTVIIERIDIHVIDDQGTPKEPQADPLSTPLDAFYLRSL